MLLENLLIKNIEEEKHFSSLFLLFDDIWNE